MDDLFAGLDDSFFAAAPSSPIKAAPPCLPSTSNASRGRADSSSHLTPRKLVTKAADPAAARGENIDSLLDGAENWDWNDMDEDFLTPKKEKSRVCLLPLSQ